MSAFSCTTRRPSRELLPDDVAEDAALLLREMPPRAVELLAHEVGHDRQRDQLRMRCSSVAPAAAP